MIIRITAFASVRYGQVAIATRFHVSVAVQM
jgi:hypothetical protein